MDTLDADAETEVYEPPKKKMQKIRISRELCVNEVPMKNLQQIKASREIQGTSRDADDEDVFRESTTEEDSDDLNLKEWERESEFESTDSDSNDADWDP